MWRDGEHGRLYLHAIRYASIPVQEGPEFTAKVYGYDFAHALDRFYSDPDDGWQALEIARVIHGRIQSAWTWHKCPTVRSL